MRFAILALVVMASCGPPPAAQDTMPTDTLEHQKPGADTSHNPVIHQYGSKHWWSRVHLFPSGPTNAFANSAAPPHYYTGCGGCSSDDPSSLLVLVGLVPLARRRRRIRG